MEALSLLHTEPRTEERVRAAMEFGELVLCIAETTHDATPEEVEQLGDVLANTTLSEVIGLALEGMRS